MKKFLNFKKVLALVLAVVLALPTSLTPVNANEAKPVRFEKVEDSAAKKMPVVREKVETPAVTSRYSDTDRVRVTIVLEDDSAIEAGYSIDDIAVNAKALAYIDTIQDKQDVMANRISSVINEELDVVWNLTVAGNAISANVLYGDIPAIEKLGGVEQVIIETQYEPCTTVETTDGTDVGTIVSTETSGSQRAWVKGYTGAGSRIAIVDTGLSIDHQSFNDDAFMYGLEKAVEESRHGLTLEKMHLLDTEEIASVLPYLQSYSRMGGRLTADMLYNSHKLPYTFNYVDYNLNVTHLYDTQGEHGSHVTGIAAANRYIKTYNGFKDALEVAAVAGNAPDAQVLVMKVFGANGGAYDSDYMAAIQDAIFLGCDSVNLSLGSGAAGMTTSAYYQNLMDLLTAFDMVVVMSAGNNSYWAENTYYGYLYNDGVNFDTAGSPGSYRNPLTVASVDNVSVVSFDFTVDGYTYTYYASSGAACDSFSTLAGERGYVFLTSVGEEEDYDGIDVNGKIVFVSRGVTNFSDKAQIAYSKGAIATVIYNNTDGGISPVISGYTGKAPVIGITYDDAMDIKDSSSFVSNSNGDNYYVGTLSVSGKASLVPQSEYAQMSDFSSWGVPGDLSMKPEITAPGGNIYSVEGTYYDADLGGLIGGTTAYELMSGTSMAAPQITGMMAVLKQFIRENGYVGVNGLTDRAIAQSLLMSTAEPIADYGSMYMYSVLQQGAGLANVYKAMNAGTVVVMDEDATKSYADGKVKVELGDDPKKTGVYEFGFKLYNVSAEPRSYSLDSYVFTQAVYPYDRDTTFLLTDTMGIDADVQFTVNGKIIGSNGTISTSADYAQKAEKLELAESQLEMYYMKASALELDILDAEAEYKADRTNEDAFKRFVYLKHMLTKTEAKSEALEDKVNKLENEIEEILENEGVIGGQGDIVVPKGGFVDVRVKITLSDDTKALFDIYYPKGAYIEAFIFADSEDSSSSHSIPVLGYYGNWTDPSMFDVGTYTELNNYTEPRFPYLYDYNWILGNMFKYYCAEDDDWYPFEGNLYADEETYDPEKNALNNTNGDCIKSVKYALIRNAGFMMVRVEDLNNPSKIYYQQILSSEYAAYFVPSTGEFSNYSSEIKMNWAGTDLSGNPLPEGTEVKITLYAVPEYYSDGKGNYDISKVGDGAKLSTQLVIDNTAPVINNVTKDEATGAISITASDNEYISAIQICGEDGEAYDWDSFAVGEKEFSGVIAEDLDDDVYMIYVCDYAGNTSTYRVFMNVEETNEVEEVWINAYELSLVKNNTAKLEAYAYPVNLSDRSVTWSSSNTSVATVDQNGVVTAVATGTCDIVATSVLDTECYAICEVEVVEINVDLNAVVWDENADVWFSEFNTSTIPSYTKLTDEPGNIYINAMAQDVDGTIYASDLDTENMISSLYTVDADTFEITKIGDSQIGYTDLTILPNCGENLLLATYGPYIVIVDATTGDYVGVFNWSKNGNNLVGISYLGYVYNSFYSANVDQYLILDDAGDVYIEGFINLDGDIYNYFGQGTTSFYMSTGVECDSPFFQSLYYDFDEDMFFISNFNDADNCVVIYASDFDSIFKLGQFAEGVWPIAALGKYEGLHVTSAKTDVFATAEVKEKASKEAISTLNFKAVTK